MSANTFRIDVETSMPKHPPLPTKSLLWVAPAVIGTGILASTVYLFSQDLTSLAKAFQNDITAAAGRPVTIAGPITLDYDHGLKVTAQNITVPNADWGQAEHFSKIDRVIATLTLAPLLTGTLSIAEVHIQDAEISLEENESGAQNWIANTPSTPATSPPASTDAKDEAGAQSSALPNLTFNNVTLRYHDLEIDQTQEVHIVEGALQTADNVTQFTTHGTYNKSPYRTAGTVTALTGLLSGKSASLDVTSQLDQNALMIQGSIESLAHNMFNLNVRGHIADLPALVAITKNRIDFPVKAIQMEGRVAGKRDSIDLNNMRLALDDSTVTGNLRIAQGETLNISGEIKTDVIDLNRFFESSDAQAGQPTKDVRTSEGAQKTASSKPQRVFSSDPLPLEDLIAVTGDLTVQADKVVYDDLTLTNLTSAVIAQDGVLQTKAVTFNLSGGTFTGSFALDVNATPSLTVEATLSDIDLADLLTSLGNDDAISGKTDLHISLNGQGQSATQIAETLSGSSELIIQDGTVKSGVIDFLAADFFRALASSVGSEETPLHCVVSRFDIDKGLATSKILLMETDLIQITGDGTINLGTEDIDINLHPRAQDLSVVNFEFDYAIGGTLAAPRYAPKATSVALSIAKTAAGTALTGGLGTIGSNVATGVLKSGLGKEELCQQAIDGTLETEGEKNNSEGNE